jgi:hypothetical protein
MAGPKKSYALYYFEDGASAKARANELRAEGDNMVILIDAANFKDKENTDCVEYMDSVPDYLKERIRAEYAGEVRETSADDEEDDKIDVPANWQKMSWTKMQALAAEIAPDETIRTKDEAKEIIAKYIEDQED